MFAEIMKIGSTNIRGMRDPVKREEVIVQMERYNIDIMCLQEAKIPDSCYEVREGFIFVFSSVSTLREHWGVGNFYRSYVNIQEPRKTNPEQYGVNGNHARKPAGYNLVDIHTT